MIYLVNGEKLTRSELIEKVLNLVLDLGKDKAPTMAYIGNNTIERNVNKHACKIARSLGWEVETII